MGKKRLTTEEFIIRSILVHGYLYGYENVNYINNRIKVSITCRIHGEFLQSPSHHMSGTGCPACFGSVKHTFATLSDAINKKHNGQITLLPNQEIDRRDKKYSFKHSCGYIWSASAGNILSGKSCPKCANQIPHNFDTLSEAVKRKHNGSIELVEGQEIDRVVLKYKFRHKCGHVWLAKANNIMNGRSCPKCSISGFDPTKPSIFYILDINGNHKFTGFGISNTYKNRKSQHKRNLKNNNCSITCETLISADGVTVQELECYVKQTLQSANINITGFKKESVLVPPETLLKLCKDWLILNNKEYSILN